jgi:hypothetical protein
VEQPRISSQMLHAGQRLRERVDLLDDLARCADQDVPLVDSSVLPKRLIICLPWCDRHP